MKPKRWNLWNKICNDTKTTNGAKRIRNSRIRLERLEARQLLAADVDFSLELLHVADQEAGAAAVTDAPNLSAVLNALRAQDLGADGVADNTLTLSSGDAFIPGLFFDASEPVFGAAGIADIQIQNELGFQAIALGNHEFDLGTGVLADLIDGVDGDGDPLGNFAALTSGTALDGLDYTGADFPYLSSNLDFSTDPNLAGLEVAGADVPQSNSVTSSVVIDVNGEDIAVIGATTPTLGSISSPGGVGISPSPFDGTPSAGQLDALAAEIQVEVDAVLANPAYEIDKVILLAHMQRLDIEIGLAERLENVDIIVAGGSNTRLFDADDRPRDGDSDQGEYPQFVTNIGGTTTAVVNTDGSYKYVGRLVIGFDHAGNIVPESYDAAVSGAYATDAQGVTDLGAEGLIDPEIQAIADAIEARIIATESNVFGVSDVFLNGNRSGDEPDGVRTQETNLGNLTADANLAEAQKSDDSVVLSLKNGGGIRANIGQLFVPPGGTDAVRLPNEEVVDGEGNVIKPEGGISQNDIQTTLAFNNGLALLTLTKSEVVGLLEHGVGALPGVSGRFPQISGVKFSYDPEAPSGDRIVNAGVFDDDGELIAKLVEDGELAGDPDETFRIVTLSFLAAPRFDDDGNFIGGGDGYPFPNFNTDGSEGDEVGDPAVIARVDYVGLEQEGVADGDAVFADNGTEQDALAEYLNDYFPLDSENAYGEADTGRDLDQRIQAIGLRADTVFPVKGTVRVTTDADTGEGSFRFAVQIANDNPGVKKIKFDRGLDTIVLDSPVEFTGSQDLKIQGKGVTIQASDAFSGDGVFISSGAADLAISQLTVDGDYDEGESFSNGIYIPVPADATGKLVLEFDRVTVKNAALHGIHIADQLHDSDAGVKLVMNRSRVFNNGIGTLDYDGVRVDEGGLGDLHASIRSSRIDANGGDGLELDERGDGSVDAYVAHSTFNDNGFFDEDYDPVEDAPRDEQDLDDGFDIDEAGAGGIRATIVRTDVVNNFDEGLDFDEEDEGGIHVSLSHVRAIGNSDEGVKASEEGEGGLVAHISHLDLIGNGDDDKSFEDNGGEGMQLEEEDEGSLSVSLSHVDVIGNASEGMKIEESDEGDLSATLYNIDARSNGGFEGDTGIKIEEADEGNFFARLRRVDVQDSGDHGIELLESGDGSFLGFLRGVESNDNAGVGIVAEQEDDGFGLLFAFDVEAEDNGEGPDDIEGILLLGDIDD